MHVCVYMCVYIYTVYGYMHIHSLCNRWNSLMNSLEAALSLPYLLNRLTLVESSSCLTDFCYLHKSYVNVSEQ